MTKVTVGKCGKCGKDLKVKKTAAKSLMRLTCKCGWSGFIGYNICTICGKQLIAIDGERPLLVCPGPCENELKQRHEKEQSDNFVRIVEHTRNKIFDLINRGHEAVNNDQNESQYNDKWMCPNCKRIFQKNEEIEALSAIGSVLVLGENQHRCPECGYAIDITSLLGGDYDC